METWLQGGFKHVKHNRIRIMKRPFTSWAQIVKCVWFKAEGLPVEDEEWDANVQQTFLTGATACRNEDEKRESPRLLVIEDDEDEGITGESKEEPGPPR